MVYVLFSEGFEEIEAITPIDLLRRAGVEVKLVGVTEMSVKGAHDMILQMDIPLKGADLADAEMVVIPGGLGCVDGIMDSSDALTFIEKVAEHGGWVAAICAAPTILSYLGLLDRRNATCYPTLSEKMGSAVVQTGHRVVVDGRFITAQAAGSSFRFAARLIRALRGDHTAEKVMNAICY